MRRKHPVTVGGTVGREFRFAAPVNCLGSWAAIGAVRGHLTHAHPEIDPAEYDAAAQQGIEGQF